jgi:hypothetical protein
VSAAAKRRRSRASNSRRRAPAHVDPVLDPNWRSAYEPTNAEREANHRAVRDAEWRGQRPALAAAAVLAAVSLFLFAVTWYLALGGLVLAGGICAFSLSRLRALEDAAPELGGQLQGQFTEAAASAGRERLVVIVDRLAATFGLGDVVVSIILDEAYNAALLPTEAGYGLLVTSAMARDFELIELEGVVAHLMARQRLGLLDREAAAAVSRLDEVRAHRLAGAAQAVRADEVAAAAIRYPSGLADALRRCAAHRAPEGSYFRSDRYRASRWVWFDLFADTPTSLVGDVDDVAVRARALAEW